MAGAANSAGSGGVRDHDWGVRVVTLKALQERSYSAVMAATGLMYLAILTSFGTDLVAARCLLVEPQCMRRI